jgi:hypothetical protein
MKPRNVASSGVSQRNPTPKGQVLVLVAVMMVVLIGLTGLAVDVSGAYLSARYERSIADSAALAAAQDLQTPGSRNIPPNGYSNARGHALKLLADQFNTTVPSCPLTGDWIVNCRMPGTEYWVSVKVNPAPSCASNCDPLRSAQVTIRRPNFALAFARIFSFASWNVPVPSVAGVDFTANYGVVTLRPPAPSGASNPSCSPFCDQNYDNIKVANSVLNVFNSDIGTNTNVAITGHGEVNLEPGYNVYRFDQYQFWTSPPPSKPLSTWIPDPNYTIPTPTASTPIFNGDSFETPTGSPACATAKTTAVNNGYTFPATANFRCYRPGVYRDAGTISGQLTASSNTDVALLLPGVYFLEKGADIGGYLVGGYEPNSPGVALVFNECGTADCWFSGANAELISLNYGTRYGDRTGGVVARAAQFNGAPVQTSGTPGVLMSLLVNKDNPNLCYPGASYPVTCTGAVENSHATIRLPGNGNLFIAGVQYAPDDNVSVNGNGSGTSGEIGQIIAWTITYTGGAVMNQIAAVAQANGVLRLEQVCSDALHVGCDNPEAIAPIP